MNLQPRLCLLALACSSALCAVVHAESPDTPRPFSQGAIGISLGTQGVGFETATNLGTRLNLRGGSDFLHVNEGFTYDGTAINGRVALTSGQMSLDWRPFRRGSFRISPGVMLYNGTRLNAQMRVSAGQSFDMNDATYYSSSSDPIQGAFAVTFPKAGPRLTLGFGNMIPSRRSKHFVVTSEFGAAYFGHGVVSQTITGTACQSPDPSTCMAVASNPDFQSNVAAEQAKLQKDMRYARFYPILKIGFGVHF